MRAVRVFVVALATVAASLSVVSGVSAAVEPPGGVYTPLSTPARILDTRTTGGGHLRPFGPNETFTLTVPGVPSGATAVAINLAGTGGTAPTFLSTFPNQHTGTSNLNLETGQTAAVAAVVTLGSNSSIGIRNNIGSVEVIVDLVGYFAPSSGTAFAAASSPTRILDTRTPVGNHAAPLGPGETMTLPVRGIRGCQKTPPRSSSTWPA